MNLSAVPRDPPVDESLRAIEQIQSELEEQRRRRRENAMKSSGHATEFQSGRSLLPLRLQELRGQKAQSSSTTAAELEMQSHRYLTTQSCLLAQRNVEESAAEGNPRSEAGSEARGGGGSEQGSEKGSEPGGEDGSEAEDSMLRVENAFNEIFERLHTNPYRV